MPSRVGAKAVHGLFLLENGGITSSLRDKSQPYIRAMKGFATTAGLLPEQVWDEPDRPEAHMYLGRPTGAAMPLTWAHAEYIKLLRSTFDGRVFDLIPEVEDRYIKNRKSCMPLEIWKPNRQVCTVKKGYTLRIQAPASFRLRWSRDDWQTVEDTPSKPTRLGIDYINISGLSSQTAPIRFTFFWTESNRWEGRDYVVAVE